MLSTSQLLGVKEHAKTCEVPPEGDDDDFPALALALATWAVCALGPTALRRMVVAAGDSPSPGRIKVRRFDIVVRETCSRTCHWPRPGSSSKLLAATEKNKMQILSATAGLTPTRLEGMRGRRLAPKARRMTANNTATSKVRRILLDEHPEVCGQQIDVVQRATTLKVLCTNA